LTRLNDVLGDNDWHTPVLPGGNDGERYHAIFRRALDQALTDAKNNNETKIIPGQLHEWWDRLDNEISALPQSEPRQLSALQIVERLDRFVFKTSKNPAAALQAIWQASSDNLTQKVSKLLSLVDNSGYGTYFYRALLAESNRDALYRYVVGEFESAHDGKWLHGHADFELEHIFPQEPLSADLGTLKQYGFVDWQDYQDFNGTLGNRILIPRGINRAVGNQWPDIKATAYAKQSFAETIVPSEQQRRSVIDLGLALQKVEDKRFLRLALEMRRIELALFALKRF
jgi:hypothetical protein